MASVEEDNLKMYTDTGLLFSYFRSFAPENQLWSNSLEFLNPNASDVLGQTTEYDLGVEADMFEAPQIVIEEPDVDLDLDPLALAISSMISGEQNVLSAEINQISDIASSQINPLLTEDLYEWQNDLLKNSPVEMKDHFFQPEENMVTGKDDPFITDGTIHKSVSSGCLSSMEWLNHSDGIEPNILTFLRGDSETDMGMKRSFSHGDIQTLAFSQPDPKYYVQQSLLTVTSHASEERKQKLSRYRRKKNRRNFNRKIKYACRKALAEIQPRIRGRFARTETLGSFKSA